jgi:hypothetical protein
MRNRSVAFLLACVACVFSSTGQAQNLLTNGDFESGLTGWTVWSAPATSFWNGTWEHSNDCDIWVPTSGCPLAGAESHTQKKGSGAGNAHGGITQSLAVTPGQTYAVSGLWSGGVTANLDGDNGTWWEVVVYDGSPSDAEIDAGIGADDTLIAKREVNDLASNAVFQFQAETFSGEFTARSSQVTLAFKTGSFYTLDAAAYHDAVSITAVQAEAVPLFSPGALALLILSFAALLMRKRAVI